MSEPSAKRSRPWLTRLPSIGRGIEIGPVRIARHLAPRRGGGVAAYTYVGLRRRRRHNSLATWLDRRLWAAMLRLSLRAQRTAEDLEAFEQACDGLTVRVEQLEAELATARRELAVARQQGRG